jgi:crossover junction endodeoxyribonuclease RusA
MEPRPDARLDHDRLSALVLDLVLPLPPSINHQYATVNGRRLLSRDGRDFKALVAEEVEAWQDRAALSNQTMAQFGLYDLSLEIAFYFVTPRRRDLDGGLKIAQDALCEALGVNDNRIAEIHLYKRVDRERPRIEVLLCALPDAVLPDGLKTTSSMPPVPVPNPKRRRRRRKQRSLEELTRRHNW